VPDSRSVSTCARPTCLPWRLCGPLASRPATRPRMAPLPVSDWLASAGHLKRGHEAPALPIRIPDAGRGLSGARLEAGRALGLAPFGKSAKCSTPEAERERPLSRVRAEAGSRSPEGECRRAFDHCGREPGLRSWEWSSWKRRSSDSGGSLKARLYVQFSPAAYLSNRFRWSKNYRMHE
jgi:hypothetical protein